MSVEYETPLDGASTSDLIRELCDRLQSEEELSEETLDGIVEIENFRSNYYFRRNMRDWQARRDVVKTKQESQKSKITIKPQLATQQAFEGLIVHNQHSELQGRQNPQLVDQLSYELRVVRAYLSDEYGVVYHTMADPDPDAYTIFVYDNLKPQPIEVRCVAGGKLLWERRMKHLEYYVCEPCNSDGMVGDLHITNDMSGS